MLKVYTVKSYVSINEGDWQQVGHSGYIMTDNNPTERVILNNATFDECCEYVSQHPLDGIYLSSTLFKKKPIIYIDDRYLCEHRYDHFNTISYKYVCEQLKNVTLDCIMKKFSADKCIQYLKERGMSACPMNF